MARGGMAVVYRAVHVASGEHVAVKTVQVPRPSVLDGLRREIHALSRLRHPGIVRIHEQGIEDGVPWYAMEILEGGTLEIGSPRALRLVRRLCGTLAFLHGEGIVHRDLKPSNVVVRAGGEPVLVDFGLVSRFAGAVSREALEVAGETLGTVGYMAPEQLRGEYVDARADLYALGCMIYEAITGRPPFTGRLWEVAGQHLRARPAPPSQHVAGIPRELDALVLELLEKDPRDRLGHASDVAAALARVVDLPDERPPVPPRAYLYRPAFSGRREVVAELKKIVAAVDRGSGWRVFLGGESGAGKTRLAMEAARLARQAGIHVVAGECEPTHGAFAAAFGAPLAPLVPLLRSIGDHCRAGSEGMTERVLGRRGRVLSAYEPSLAELPGQADHPEPPALPPQAARARLLADLAESILAFAREVPLVLVLDDLQWADELTLALLASLREDAFDGARLLLLGTFRGEELGPALRAVFHPKDAVVELGRLDAGTIATIVRDMMAVAEPPAELVAVLSRESEGNPFFVAEYLRAAVDERLLSRSPDGRWQLAAPIAEARLPERLPLPRTLLDLVGRRIQGLSAAARALVEMGAVVGREFELDLVASALALGDAARMDAIAELLDRRVVEDLEAGRFRFAHDKLREVAYAGVEPGRRRVLHRATAEGIARRHALEDLAPHAAALAGHWEQAGDDGLAIAWLERAGEHALRMAAHAEASAHLGRALALAARDPGTVDALRQARWLRMLGEARFGLGQVDEASRAAKDALARLEERVPRGAPAWAARLGQELARQAAHRLLPARAFVAPRGERARALEAAYAAGQLATTYYFTNEAVPMLTALLVGANRAERAGSPASAIQAYARLGYVVGIGGLTPLARSYFRLAYDLAREAGDESGYGFTRYLDAFWHLGLGEWAHVERGAAEAVARLEAIGDRQDTEVAQAIGAHAVYYAGRFAESERTYLAILASARERENAQHIGWGLFLAARSQLAAGRVDEALRNLEAAVPFADLEMDVLSIPICEGLLASARLAQGDLARALELEPRLAARIEGPPLALAPCLHGYIGLCELRLEAWRRGLAGLGPREASERTRAAVRALDRFALVFPMARPAAHRMHARALWLEGREGRAARRRKRAIAEARRRAMPHEEALAWLDAARDGARDGLGADPSEQAAAKLGALGATQSATRTRRAG